MKIATLSNASVVHTVRWVEHLRSRGHDVRVWSLERGPEALAARAARAAAARLRALSARHAAAAA